MKIFNNSFIIVKLKKSCRVPLKYANDLTLNCNLSSSARLAQSVERETFNQVIEKELLPISKTLTKCKLWWFLNLIIFCVLTFPMEFELYHLVI